MKIKNLRKGIAVTGFLFLYNCANALCAAGDAANSKMESSYTSLNANACTEAIDKSDPNETSYLVCPGVAGYLLQIRQVESGRLSITVVDPAKQEFPLDYQAVVTRSMSSLDDKAEWRVRRDDSKLVPVALTVRIMARERPSDPERVTNRYLAVAKITAHRVCVTDRIRQGSKPEKEVRALADSAASRACASQLPESANPRHQTTRGQ